MSDMLIIGSSALTTFRKSLDVTSHNVANVGTEGYSRQRAEIYSNAPSIVGNSFNGGGSYVDKVERMYSDYIQKQLVDSNASVKGYQEALSYSKQVEGIIAGNDEGVQQFIQRYFDALQNLADNPTSNVNRRLVMDEANNLTGHINNISVVLDDTQYQVNSQIKDLTNQINSQLKIIQDLNSQVANAHAQSRQPPNDLLDKREQAIFELSSLVGVKTYQQPDGTIDVHSINGKVPLLSDNTITRIQADASPYPEENRVEIYAQIGGLRKQVSDLLIGGGQLGGVLDFRKNMLDRAQNELGVTMNAFVAANNWQHYMGFDENGDAGKHIFQPLEATGLAYKDNANLGGNVKVTFNPIDDGDLIAGLDTPYASGQPLTYGAKKQDLEDAYTAISEMSPDGYEMYFDGTDWTVTNLSTKEQTTFAGGGSAQIDGLRFEGTGLNLEGDRFIVKPHQAILKQFDTVIREGQEFATRGQSPIETGNVPPGVAGDPLTDASPPEPAGEGDNVNIANMASLQSKKIMYANDSGQPAETLLGGYSRMATSVGMYVRGMEIQSESQQNTYDYILERRETLSGVSLDEEAANLMRFQQAYQAAAQVMQAAQTTFQTLLGAMRG
jgi:flagellar hook-associated protein 1 FlgK